MPLFGKRSSNKTFVQVLRDTLEEGKNYSSVDPTKARVTIRKILRMIEDASKQEKQAIMENKEEVINILWEAGRTLYDLNDREKAFDFFEKIKELNPNDYKPWFEIGKTLLTLNIQIPYATVNLKKALELNPDNVETLVLLGDVYRIQKDLENAKKYYKEALKKDPGRADIAEKILTIDPNDVEVLKLLLNYYLKIDDKLKVAEVYAHLASVENNMEYIQKALELNPDNVNILKTKIRLLIENKNFQEAKVTLDRLIELVPSDSEIYILKELINNKSSENKLFEEIKPESNAVKESALFDELVGSENQVKGIENIMPDEIIAKEKSQEEKVELPEEKEEKVELPEEKEENVELPEEKEEKVELPEEKEEKVELPEEKEEKVELPEEKEEKVELPEVKEEKVESIIQITQPGQIPQSEVQKKQPETPKVSLNVSQQGKIQLRPPNEKEIQALLKNPKLGEISIKFKDNAEFISNINKILLDQYTNKQIFIPAIESLLKAGFTSKELNEISLKLGPIFDAISLFVNNRLDDADKILNQIISKDFKNSLALFYKARISSKKNNMVGAKNFWTLANKFDNFTDLKSKFPELSSL
ncbi:MAG: tetratricopeptide repeat protein [Thermoplasmata archaeon]